VRANYSLDEVRGLIENYQRAAERIDTTPRGLRWLSMLIDINNALEKLSDKYWEVLLLHGLIGIDQMQTAVLLQVRQSTVSKRYRRGLEETHHYINGGED
jgi:DNA-directed RNA polymerase specialized sigma24 family protein